MANQYAPTPCTIAIAYLSGFKIGDCYVTGQPADPHGLQAIAAAGVQEEAINDAHESGLANPSFVALARGYRPLEKS